MRDVDDFEGASRSGAAARREKPVAAQVAARAFRLAGPTSTMDAATAALREAIIRGDIGAGERLVESALTESMGVSRNTIREVFRLLETERLVVRETNRGVFVRTLTAADIADAYHVRRLVEVSSLSEADSVPAGVRRRSIAEMREALDAGREALEAGDKWGVGLADLQFHAAISELSGSPRLVEIMAGLKTELRLAFAATDVILDFHRPYVALNARILELCEGEDFAGAADALEDYLHSAEHDLLARLRAREL
ncbi:GntR family transcriptional regulator [Dietzia sp.]|uniref:GntR family transcriptional regulator n=1 Tax=Dietzia sp. TaxID=1871616 RepID=UPI002FD96831